MMMLPKCPELGVVVHDFNPSTREAEAGQPGLQSEFQDSQGSTEKPCLEEEQQKNNNNTKVLPSA